MLSRALQRVGARFGLASNGVSPARDPTINYEFLPADERDKGKIMDIALDQFLAAEPHSQAMGLNRETCGEVIDWYVSKSLHYPFSYTINHKESGKIIGFRLMSAAHRDETKDYSPFDLDYSKCAEGVQIMAAIKEGLKEDIWKLRPEANKILTRDLSFVHGDHQRQGIAQHLLHLGLDFGKLAEDGYDGIQTEASSKANQALLIKNGYQVLGESDRKSYTRKDGSPIILPDGTKSCLLVYLSLRK